MNGQRLIHFMKNNFNLKPLLNVTRYSRIKTFRYSLQTKSLSITNDLEVIIYAEKNVTSGAML